MSPDYLSRLLSVLLATGAAVLLYVLIFRALLHLRALVLRCRLERLERKRAHRRALETPFCELHPIGTDQPCGPCGIARVEHWAAVSRVMRSPRQAQLVVHIDRTGAAL